MSSTSRVSGSAACTAPVRRWIAAFRPRLDLLALTSYPINSWPTPSQVPADLYQRAADYAQEPVMLMEVGWPSAAGSNPQAQADFIDRLPGLVQDTGIATIGWSLLCDVPTTHLPALLGTTGLRTSDDTAKPGWTTFLNLAP